MQPAPDDTTTAFSPKYRVYFCPDSWERSGVAVSIDHEAEVAARVALAQLDAGGGIADAMSTPQPAGNSMADGDADFSAGAAAALPSTRVDGAHVTMPNGHHGEPTQRMSASEPRLPVNQPTTLNFACMIVSCSRQLAYL